jgi:hypothetical protein
MIVQNDENLKKVRKAIVYSEDLVQKNLVLNSPHDTVFKGLLSLYLEPCITTTDFHYTIQFQTI